MKKFISTLLMLVLCLSICSCAAPKASPEERLNDETQTFITAYLDTEVGDLLSETPGVNIVSHSEISENKWAVLGTVTLVLNDNGKTVKSTKFAVVATYNEADNGFEFSKVEFDEFN